MPDHVYPAVHKCIYCYASLEEAGTLTDEHIIPLGLGGNLILPKASCLKCQKIINKQIETPILRHEWGAFRDRHGLPTRNKKDRAARSTLSVTAIDGTPFSVPLNDHSTPVPLYRFHAPRILTNKRLPTLDHHWTISMLANNDEEVTMQRNYPKWNREHKIRMRPHLFARMLAKIGYSYAIAEYGNSTVSTFTPLAPDVIRGIRGDWTQLVGGSMDIPPPVIGGNHVTLIGILSKSPFEAHLVVDIRLFSHVSTPEYRVVVGYINFANPDHLAAFEAHRRSGKLENVPVPP